MNRAAIYARFSTDQQNEKSTEDQIKLCMEFAQREGLQVVATYEDKAKSGGSIFGRDGLFKMMQDAQERKFDVILVEAVDRLSRDMEDLAGLYKRMTFLGISIRAVHEGVVNTVLVGLRGLVGQLYREDNVHKTKRGMASLVDKGLSAGGRAYGYRPDPNQKGKLIIVEEEAEIIRRIFEEYASGKPPRKIAHDLNEEGVPPPRGTKWNASTINGNASRGHGILRNHIYAGKLVWNRVRMIRDPDTGKRLSRPNPPDQWRFKDVPELQIVPTELWEKVQELKRATANVPLHAQARKPKRLLSGLLRCGSCGAGMSIQGADKTNRKRIRCSAAVESGTCPDPKTFYLDTVENLVLDALAEELTNPEATAVYLKEYIEERKRLAKEIADNRAYYERQLAKVVGEMDRLLTLYQKSVVELDMLEAKMPQLRAERDRLRELLAAQPEVPKTIDLHPMAVKKFEEQLKSLKKAVEAGVTEGDGESIKALREVIETVTVYRDDSKVGGVRVEIRGYLNPLVAIGDATKKAEKEVSDVTGKTVGSGDDLSGSGGLTHSESSLKVIRFCISRAA